MPAPLTLLVDNGSLEPAATLGLRELASQLAAKLGEPVEPVSLLHSSAIAPERIGGTPAEILFPALEKRVATGIHDFLVLPLFFGPSGALTGYLPENLARLKAKHPALNVRLAPHLHRADDNRLARIIADHVRAEIVSPNDRVALVDHGSPVAAVTEVRNALAQQVAALLGNTVAAIAPCSMERRPAPEYDFCKPLLTDLLATAPWNESRVIVAMQFLLPGRHAGREGDVAEICRAAEIKHAQLRTQMTRLVAEHPLLIQILADRWGAAR
ncbi:sirohydrochlorin chelatase [Oleiharenicola lentus]|uniref:sirohydrochlorin chelatase n=1 Tax=Oleiharenicola lentus TaxID=2508720 RepID=UPI003F677185